MNKTALEILKNHVTIFNEENADTCFIDSHPKRILEAMEEYRNQLPSGVPSDEEITKTVKDHTESFTGNGDYYFTYLETEIAEILLKQMRDRLAPMISKLEEAKKLLAETKKEFQWTWDNMAMPHTSDHFNRPANAINDIEEFIKTLP